MACKNICRLCNKLILSSAVNFDSTSNELIIAIPEGTYYNNEKYCIKVSAKIRYIDPIVNDERYSRLDENFNDEIIQLLSTNFDFYLTSVEENMIS